MHNIIVIKFHFIDKVNTKNPQYRDIKSVFMTLNKRINFATRKHIFNRGYFVFPKLVLKIFNIN